MLPFQLFILKPCLPLSFWTGFHFYTRVQLVSSLWFLNSHLHLLYFFVLVFADAWISRFLYIFFMLNKLFLLVLFCWFICRDDWCSILLFISWDSIGPVFKSIPFVCGLGFSLSKIISLLINKTLRAAIVCISCWGFFLCFPWRVIFVHCIWICLLKSRHIIGGVFRLFVVGLVNNGGRVIISF